jgi:predicted nucleotidyltransferase
VTEPGQLEAELGRVAIELARRGRGFALVGGLAVSIRGEVRFTRDVDIAVAVSSDADTESLVRDLRASGYDVAAIVEHETVGRLSTVRLRSRTGVKVDLLAASSGIEPEIVRAATPVTIEVAGAIPVASTEDLLATKVLSMSDRRPLDRADARGLVLARPDLDLDRVRARLRLIRERGFDREQDLEAKLDGLLAEVEADR